MNRWVRPLLLHAALVAGVVAILAPLLWMVGVSFMPTGASQVEPPPLLPKQPTLEQYRQLFLRLNLARALGNSLLVSLGATLCAVVCNGLAGYAFACLRFRGRDRLFAALLLLLLIPGQVAILPLFLLLRTLGLTNTLVGVALPSFASVFGIFMVRQYALSIPQELLEAARVDGASEGRIALQVVFPLLRPVLVTLAAFTFVGTWNDFLWPLVVLSDERWYTLPVALATLAGEHTHDAELMMAGAVMTMAPVLLVFAFLQRHYIRGLTLGGVKE
ncbi:MAG: carbohydrate ABC transporter permease [Thermoanaerobaculum sp.]|nr:carbohydrate ABC transporter permease [Thermoanaerobaculum sp.]